MPDNTIGFVGTIPAHYDKHLGPVIFEPYAQDIAARLAAPESAAVLEVACGTGIVTRRLLERLPDGARLVATDLNEAMIDHARGRVPADPRLQWRPADAQSLPFEDASFDRVVCQFGAMFFPDKAGAARESRRVLRPGGRLLFNVWDAFEHNAFARIAHGVIMEFFPENPPQFYLTPFGYHDDAILRADLEAAGFRDIAIDVVRKDAVAVSARDFAIGLVLGNPVLLAIEERGTADPGAVVDAVATALAAEGGAAPFRSELSAKMITAS